MKAAEIVDATLSALRTGAHRCARINLANGDMVGHTGDRDAAILAVQCVDWALGRLLAGVEALGGVALVTADHGNCEEMYSRDKGGRFDCGPDGLPKAKTSHTTNPVPLSLFDPTQAAATVGRQLKSPGLGNLAATVCELLGYAPPEGYLPSLLVPRTR
jgi:2,3-bisphosphoglycerate-independent phosphoglycerate mutase